MTGLLEMDLSFPPAIGSTGNLLMLYQRIFQNGLLGAQVSFQCAGLPVSDKGEFNRYASELLLYR